MHINIRQAILLVWILLVILFSQAAYAQTGNGHISASPAKYLVWKRAIMSRHIPENGCSTAIYPANEWKRVPCTTLPKRLQNIARRPPSLVKSKSSPFLATVGNGTDITAQATQGLITRVDGSFAKVQTTGVVNVTGDGKVVSNKDQFSLQINTNFFTTPLCGKVAACRGWEQFVLSNDPGSPPAYMWTQHWLLGLGSPCPKGWGAVAGGDCVLDSNGVSPPILSNVPLNLKFLWMSAAVVNGQDVVTIGYTSGATIANAVSSDSVLGLGSRWTESEFNIVGDLTLHNARFDPNTTIVINQDLTISGAASTNPVKSIVAGTTGETNNLNLVTPTCVLGQRVAFEESNVSGVKFGCSTPTPQNACALATKAVAADQAALQRLEDRLSKPICSGPVRLECVQAANGERAKLQADLKVEKAQCH